VESHIITLQNSLLINGFGTIYRDSANLKTPRYIRCFQEYFLREICCRRFSAYQWYNWEYILDYIQK